MQNHLLKKNIKEKKKGTKKNWDGSVILCVSDPNFPNDCSSSHRHNSKLFIDIDVINFQEYFVEERTPSEAIEKETKVQHTISS